MLQIVPQLWASTMNKIATWYDTG